MCGSTLTNQNLYDKELGNQQAERRPWQSEELVELLEISRRYKGRQLLRSGKSKTKPAPKVFGIGIIQRVW